MTILFLHYITLHYINYSNNLLQDLFKEKHGIFKLVLKLQCSLQLRFIMNKTEEEESKI